MVQLPAAFNPNAPGQDGVGDWTPIPVGDYQAHVKDSKMVATKDNPNHFFLEVDWEILAGEQAGSIMIQRLNLVNSNAKAVEIAQKHLKSICDAMAITGPISDSVVLHNKPILISIIQTKPTANYGAGNDIKKYQPIAGAVAAVAGAAVGAVAAPVVAAPVGAPAWAGAAAATPVAPVVPVVPAAPVAAPVVPVAPVAEPAPVADPAPVAEAEVAPVETKAPWVK